MPSKGTGSQARKVSPIHTSARLRWLGLVGKAGPQGTRALSWQPPPPTVHGTAESNSGQSLGCLPCWDPALAPSTMKLQVFWTGLEYTCRILGITTAAGKITSLLQSSAHGVERTGLHERWKSAGQGWADTSDHICPSLSFPRPQETVLCGAAAGQWGKLGTGNQRAPGALGLLIF